MLYMPFLSPFFLSIAISSSLIFCQAPPPFLPSPTPTTTSSPFVFIQSDDRVVTEQLPQRLMMMLTLADADEVAGRRLRPSHCGHDSALCARSLSRLRRRGWEVNGFDTPPPNSFSLSPPPPLLSIPSLFLFCEARGQDVRSLVVILTAGTVPLFP